MNKYIFWCVSYLYSLIYTLITPYVKNIATIIGGSIGTWFWLGLFSYLVTHLGKGKKNPSRNVYALIVSTIMFLILISRNIGVISQNQNTIPANNYTYSSSKGESLTDALMQGINNLEQNNALAALMIRNNPSLKNKFVNAMQTDLNKNPYLLQKWADTHSFNISDLESMPSLSAALEKELTKYIPYATDQDIYEMYEVEYKHLVKNKCQVFPIPEEDRQETIRVKSKLIENSLKNTHKGKTMSEDEITKTYEQITIQYYNSGYNVNNLMRMLEDDKTLSKEELCSAHIGFLKAMLSLPKEKCIIFARSVLQ